MSQVRSRRPAPGRFSRTAHRRRTTATALWLALVLAALLFVALEVRALSTFAVADDTSALPRQTPGVVAGHTVAAVPGIEALSRRPRGRPAAPRTPNGIRVEARMLPAHPADGKMRPMRRSPEARDER